MGDEDTLQSAFIVWVDYGSEGWRPVGYDDENDALRDIASGRFGARVVITGPVIFPPSKED